MKQWLNYFTLKRGFKGLFFLSIILCVRLCFAGDDPLAGVIDENITPALGTQSTFFKLLCFGEILGAIGAYWKSRSFAVLAGVVFVALFFDVAYKHYVG